MINVKNLDVNSEVVTDFLKKDPDKLNNEYRSAWFYLKRKKQQQDKKNRDYFYKCVHALGYDLSFIGYKDKNKKVLSFYSPSYARRNNEKYGVNKYVSRFSTADTYENFKNKVIATEDNYGFIQKEISQVLWLDLDCHDDALIEEYKKIRDWCVWSFSKYSLIEHKNNGKGTHIWLLYTDDMCKEERKKQYNQIVEIVHLETGIPLDICFKIIDKPKAWFRVPCTKEYKADPNFTYVDLYKEILNKKFVNVLAMDGFYKEICENHSIENAASIESNHQTEKAVKPKDSDCVDKTDFVLSEEYKSSESHKIIENGLSKGNSYRELSIVVPWMVKSFRKINMKEQISVDNFVSLIKAFGKGKGTADILSNEEELRSRVQYLFDNMEILKSSDNNVFPDNWRDYLTQEQKDIELEVLENFVKQNKQCIKYNITVESLQKMVDYFLSKYFLVQAPFCFNKLCGNFSAKHIIEQLKLQNKTYDICSKIQKICSNLYGFYKIIDKNGKFYIPGVISCRYVFLKNNEILTGDSIFQDIGENMIRCREKLKYTRMNQLNELLGTVPSIYDTNITYVETNDTTAFKAYFKEKQDTIKEMNPEGIRKTKSELQEEAENRAYKKSCTEFRLGF